MTVTEEPVRRPGQRREARQARDFASTARRRPLVEHIDFAREMTEGTFDPSGFFVYLLFELGRSDPFYVGQSSNLFGRLGVHYTNHGARILRVSVLRCVDRPTMNATEMELIKRYRPLLNIIGIN